MVTSQGSQLEAWERQLVFLEIGLISGLPNPPHKELSHAWGREKGFHNVLVSQICERRGEVERKKRELMRLKAARAFVKQAKDMKVKGAIQRWLYALSMGKEPKK
mgnify:CR=1 FL=1